MSHPFSICWTPLLVIKNKGVSIDSLNLSIDFNLVVIMIIGGEQ